MAARNSVNASVASASGLQSTCSTRKSAFPEEPPTSMDGFHVNYLAFFIGERPILFAANRYSSIARITYAAILFSNCISVIKNSY